MLWTVIACSAPSFQCSRSRFAPLRKFRQSISYVRLRYSRVAASARVAGYLCIAVYLCIVGYPCVVGYPRVVEYPCLTFMAQVLLFLDVAAHVALLNASKIPQRPNSIGRSAGVLDAGLLPEFVFSRSCFAPFWRFG